MALSIELEKIGNNKHGGNMIYILITFFVIFAIIFAILIFPTKIDISFVTKGLGSLNSEEEIKKIKKTNTKIYILDFLKVLDKKSDSTLSDRNKKTKDKFNNEKILKTNHLLNLIYSLSFETIGITKLQKALVSKKELEKIFKNIYFEECFFNIAFNSENHILNSYINMIANTFLCMYINKNINRFNLSKLRYSVNVSKNVYEIEFKGIIKFRLINNIYELFKILIRYLKLKKEEKKGKESEENGRTSNRKLNDDNYDIS